MEPDDQWRARPARVDIPAAIRRITALEAVRRERRRIVAGVALIPLSCWFAISRYHPDYAWSPAELALVAPLLGVASGMILVGIRRYLRLGDQGES